jgi:hypothetical protein
VADGYGGFQPTTAKAPEPLRKSWQITRLGDGQRRHRLSRLPAKADVRSYSQMHETAIRMKRFFPLVLLMASFGVVAQPDDMKEDFRAKNAKTYGLEIQQRLPASLNSSSFRAYGYRGADGANPSYCISSLKLAREKVLVRISAKHFLDLCNVHRAWFTEKGPHVILTLQGGDAVDSYKAEFKLHGVNLVERVVRDGEFPEVFERTQLSYPSVAN